MSFLSRLKEKSRKLQTEIIALYLSFKDKRTPLVPKLLIILTVGYAISPIDLIPDFIPVLGYMDDLVILPALITISIKLIPAVVMDECRIRARESIIINRKIGVYAASVIVLFWIIVLSYLLYSAIG